mgnify:CR=1 FL=1
MRIKCNSACFLSLILLALTASTGTAQQYSASQPQMQQSNSIHWLNDIANAKQLAAQSGRLVYIHFYSDNCAACDDATTCTTAADGFELRRVPPVGGAAPEFSDAAFVDSFYERVRSMVRAAVGADRVAVFVIRDAAGL